MKHIAVLLSTYNGEKYLAEQIESVLAQEGVQVTLFVRDDGSRDGTLALLRSYADECENVRVDAAANVGVIRSFMSLLGQAGEGFDYYAFCDQDDFWEKDKLLTAVRALEASTVSPCLYTCAVGYVDVNLQPIGQSRAACVPSFGNALIENIAAGCTSVFDGALRSLLVEHMPTRAGMHDWWVYLMASAFGEVIFDPVPRIRYRQHGGNVVGGDARAWVMWSRRLKRFLSTPGGVMSRQAEEFHTVYGTRLSAEKRALLECFLAARTHFLSRLRLALGFALRRQSPVDTLVFKMLILMGRF